MQMKKSKMTKSKALRILHELRRRSLSSIDLLEDALPQQVAFINDPARLKSILATRRASKSYTAGLHLYKEALATPGVSLLYLALTRESAKRIMVKDVMSVINRKYKLGAIYNKSDLTYTMPNGAVIYLMGADSSDEEREKILGQKFKLVYIDEAASFKTDLRELVYSTLKPAMADLRGTIVLIGTPSNKTRGLFFDITTGKEPGWSTYNWKAIDNPHVSVNIKAEMDELIAQNPAIVETPLWKQMYEGKWVVDHDKLVYKYTEARNIISKLPAISNKSHYTYVLGIDLGYNDATAFSVLAYSLFDPNVYVVKTYKKEKLDITASAEKIKELAQIYPLSKMIVDGSAKQSVEEMKNRHGLPLESADKHGKFDFIEIMNSDFIMGKIKLIEADTEDLQDEYKTLIWDDRSNKRKENDSCPNHLCDATLYGWRYCYSYTYRDEAPPDEDADDMDDYWEAEANKLSSKSTKPFWEQD